MGISKKLCDIYNIAHQSIENLKASEDKLLANGIEKLKTDAEAFKETYNDDIKKFDENDAELQKREIYKSKLEFIDETGKTPAQLRENQTRVLKKVRGYFIDEVEQMDAITYLQNESARIDSGIKAMNRYQNILSEAKAVVAAGIAKTIQAVKKFFGLMFLLNVILTLITFGVFNFFGILPQTGFKRLIIASAIALGLFVILLIVFNIISSSLRRKNITKQQQLTEDTEKSYLPSYITKINAAASQITAGFEPAVKDLTERNAAFLQTLTEYYLAFLPDNIVYIINDVIDGLETGLGYGECVWRSNDRLLLNEKHEEIKESFSLVDSHLDYIETLQREQLAAQNKQIEAMNAHTAAVKAQTAAVAAQTAAVAAQTAVTAAQNAEIARQSRAFNRMADEIRSFNNKF